MQQCKLKVWALLATMSWTCCCYVMLPLSKARAFSPLFYHRSVYKAVAVNAAAHAEDMGPASAYVLDLLLSCNAVSVKGEGSNVHEQGWQC